MVCAYSTFQHCSIPSRKQSNSTEEKNTDIKKNIKNNVSNVQITFKPTQSPLAGQMVVLYDVERDKSGGDIEVVNGYFVHFIAPDGLKAGNKHIVFVLDKSGSMLGRKMEQLKVCILYY